MFFLATKKASFRFKAVAIYLLLSFTLMSVVPAKAFAQGLPGAVGLQTIVPLSSGFIPVILRGIRTHPDNPFKFDFIVDSGESGLRDDALKAESEKLIRYFLAGLTIPEDNLWVNLSPYEKDRIIPDSLGNTELGHDMLSQDYLLKQITASLINPDSDLGKEFWAKVYKKAHEQFGTTNVPVDTFNKVWIMPERAEVYENGDKAFVVESRLKVMLEEDYLALANSVQRIADSNDKNLNAPRSTLASNVVREVFIPALEKEVNEGKNFAPLRQIYNAIILSYWYKTKLKNSILNKVYSDRNKIAGIKLADSGQRIADSNDKDLNALRSTLNADVPSYIQSIYSQYLDTFKKGVCNIIKVEHDQYTNKNIPRKYFAGGVVFGKGVKPEILSANTSEGKTAGSSILASFRKRAAIALIAVVSVLFSGDHRVSQPPADPQILANEQKVAMYQQEEAMPEDNLKEYSEEEWNAVVAKVKRNPYGWETSKEVVSNAVRLAPYFKDQEEFLKILKANMRNANEVAVKNFYKIETQFHLGKEIWMSLLEETNETYAPMESVDPIAEYFNFTIKDFMKIASGYRSPIKEFEQWQKRFNFGEDGKVTSHQVSEAGLDWAVFSNKLVEKGWAKKINDTTLHLQAETEEIKENMQEVFGSDYEKVLFVFEQAHFWREQTLRHTSDALDNHKALEKKFKFGKEHWGNVFKEKMEGLSNYDEEGDPYSFRNFGWIEQKFNLGEEIWKEAIAAVPVYSSKYFSEIEEILGLGKRFWAKVVYETNVALQVFSSRDPTPIQEFLGPDLVNKMLDKAGEQDPRAYCEGGFFSKETIEKFDPKTRLEYIRNYQNEPYAQGLIAKAIQEASLTDVLFSLDSKIITEGQIQSAGGVIFDFHVPLLENGWAKKIGGDRIYFIGDINEIEGKIKVAGIDRMENGEEFYSVFQRLRTDFSQYQGYVRDRIKNAQPIELISLAPFLVSKYKLESRVERAKNDPDLGFQDGKGFDIKKIIPAMVDHYLKNPHSAARNMNLTLAAINSAGGKYYKNDLVTLISEDILKRTKNPEFNKNDLHSLLSLARSLSKTRMPDFLLAVDANEDDILYVTLGENICEFILNKLNDYPPEERNLETWNSLFQEARQIKGLCEQKNRWRRNRHIPDADAYLKYYGNYDEVFFRDVVSSLSDQDFINASVFFAQELSKAINSNGYKIPKDLEDSLASFGVIVDHKRSKIEKLIDHLRNKRYDSAQDGVTRAIKSMTSDKKNIALFAVAACLFMFLLKTKHSYKNKALGLVLLSTILTAGSSPKSNQDLARLLNLMKRDSLMVPDNVIFEDFLDENIKILNKGEVSSEDIVKIWDALKLLRDNKGNLEPKNIELVTMLNDSIVVGEDSGTPKSPSGTKTFNRKDAFKGTPYLKKGNYRVKLSDFLTASPGAGVYVIENLAGEILGELSIVHPSLGGGAALIAKDGAPIKNLSALIKKELSGKGAPLYVSNIGIALQGDASYANPTKYSFPADGFLFYKGNPLPYAESERQGLIIIRPDGSLTLANKDFLKLSDLDPQTSPENDRFLNLSEDGDKKSEYENKKEFAAIIKEKKISIVGASLLYYDGKIAKGIDQFNPTRYWEIRGFCFYSDGSFGFIDPAKEITGEEMVKLAVEGAPKGTELVALIYCDGGTWDSAIRYDKDGEGKGVTREWEKEKEEDMRPTHYLLLYAAPKKSGKKSEISASGFGIRDTFYWMPQEPSQGPAEERFIADAMEAIERSLQEPVSHPLGSPSPLAKAMIGREGFRPGSKAVSSPMGAQGPSASSASSQIVSIFQVVNEYQNDVLKRIEESRGRLEKFMESKALRLIAENEKKILEERLKEKERIDELIAKLENSSPDGLEHVTLEAFIDALKSVKGGALSKLSKQQENALRIIEKISKKHPSINIGATIFVPRSSWVHRLFWGTRPFDRAAAYHNPIGDKSLEIIIDGEKNALDTADHVVHESLHHSFDKARERVKSDLAWFYNILEEAMVEKERAEIFREFVKDKGNKDLILDNFSRYEAAVLGILRSGAIGEDVPTVYVQEQYFLNTLLASLQAEKEVQTFLAEGNEEPLKKLLGEKRWNGIVEILKPESYQENVNYSDNSDGSDDLDDFDDLDDLDNFDDVFDSENLFRDILSRRNLNLYVTSKLLTNNEDGVEALKKGNEFVQIARKNKFFKFIFSDKNSGLRLSVQEDPGLQEQIENQIERLYLGVAYDLFDRLLAEGTFGAGGSLTPTEIEEQLNRNTVILINEAIKNETIKVSSASPLASTPISTSSPVEVTDAELNPGGIDFNAANLNITTKGEAIDFAMPADLENLRPEDVPGLVPVILNIVPVTDFIRLLGLTQAEAEEFTAKEENANPQILDKARKDGLEELLIEGKVS